MHAYLLIGQKNNDWQSSINNIAKKLNAKIQEYPLQKIEDARSLNNLVRLSYSEPTLIVCKDIHESGEEALNAFLKNLEEPQENIYFALTAPNVRKVLPTIVSRCQIIKTINNQQSAIDNTDIEKFLDMKTGDKLNYISGIKERDDAIDFAEKLVFFMHSQLHQKDLKYNEQADAITAATETLTRLKANGNVNLQLANLVSQLSNAE